MKKIYKYPLLLDDLSHVEMPKGAEVLSVGIQDNNALVLWVIVDTDEKDTILRVFRISGTGHPLELDGSVKCSDMHFIGTVSQLANGIGPTNLVWHVFEYILAYRDNPSYTRTYTRRRD